jgi:hypothetical protein
MSASYIFTGVTLKKLHRRGRQYLRLMVKFFYVGLILDLWLVTE